MSDELMKLAERVEQAAKEGQGNYIITAFVVMHPEPPSGYQPRGYPAFSPIWDAWCKTNCAIRNYVRHGAYLDAAMLLIPDDMRDEIEITTIYRVARVGINLNHGPDDGPYYGENVCNSIPLAITAAALKARALSAKGESL